MGDMQINDASTFGAAANTADIFVGDVVAQAPAPQAGDKPAVQRIHSGERANHILFTFNAGQELREHMAAHPITVSCPQGKLEFSIAEGQTVVLEGGTIVHLPARVRHAVRALDEGGILWLVMHTG